MNAEEHLKCIICLEIANDALITLCCHVLLCSNCSSLLQKKPCPNCRKRPFKLQPCYFARKLITQLPVPCTNQGCKQMTTYGELKDHLKNCEFRVIKCPNSKCEFSGIRKEFLSHLVTEHASLLIEKSHLLFVKDQSANSTDNKQDMIAIVKNEKNVTSRLGITGKYYCKSHMGSCKNNCCDQQCGPDNGCNCLACMKLDIKMRRLPPGYLVNRSGFVARKSSATGLFYCGRRVLVNVPLTDGYCGPTNGPNCEACKTLDVETKSGGRYASLIA